MIDSHIHLNSKDYNEDINEVISTAKSKGITEVIQIGCDLESIHESIELQERYPDYINLAVGWHPVDVRTATNENFALVEKTVKEKKVVAIGEIGLDYHWYPEEKDAQVELFKKQIILAKKYDLPIIIHNREAYEDCYDILKEFAPLKGVMHSFSGDVEYCKKILDLGLDIGLSGPITFKNGINQKEVAKFCPLDKIHLETDGPYLTPVPYRGKRNLSEYIYYVAEEIALQKDVKISEVIDTCTQNTKRLFKLGE